MISIIIPMFNEEEHIQACLESVVPQITTSDEIIVVDDGSTDSSKMIVENFILEHPDKNILYTYQENRGLGSACNRGIKYSSKEYIQFLDADDELSEGLVSEIKNKIFEHKADLIIYDFLVKPIHGNVLIERMSLDNGLNRCEYSISELINIPPSAKNKVFKKELFIKNNIFFPEKLWFEDLDTVLKIYLHVDTYYYLEGFYYQYIHRANSIIHNPNLDKNRDISIVMEDVLSYYANLNYLEKYDEELYELLERHMCLHAPVRIMKNSVQYDKQVRNVLSNILIDFNELKNIYFPLLKINSSRNFNVKERFLIVLFKYKLFWPIYFMLKVR